MISNLAHIHPKAQIAKGVTIDAFAVINEDVFIDEGTHIMSHAVIMDGAKIGKNCFIYPGAVISGAPQDLKYKGEKTIVEIGDRTTIRECVTINKGTTDKWKTAIGNDCLIMAYAHVAHDCIIGNNVIFANGVTLAGHVNVGDYAIIGGMAGAQQFVNIGTHTYVAGQSQIRKDVPPYIKAAREPISFAGINSVGLSRRGFDKASLDAISSIYHVLYIQGFTTTEAVEFIEQNIPDSIYKNEILLFIKNSKMGIVKRFAKDNTNNEDNLF